ncbi:MAG TPA: SH3 domain-containing protein [Balneolales bacterium]|nr:SH3 domain-containing protein [Balneolales bacterium]
MSTRDYISKLSISTVVTTFVIVVALFQVQTTSAKQIPDSLRGLSPQAIFDKANIQYKAEHYNKALDLYHAIMHKNYASGALFLNMGISYIHIDSLGIAKYYFLKSSQFPETRAQAKQGLQYLSNQLSHKSAKLPELPWDKALNWLQTDIGAHNMLFIGLIILNFGILIFIATWFTDFFKKALRYSGLILTLLGIIFLLTTGFVDYHTRRYTKGVMIIKKANVKEKPDNHSGIVSIAYEGYTFTVDNKKSANHRNWYYVRLSNGLYGWIPKKDIKVL